VGEEEAKKKIHHGSQNVLKYCDEMILYQAFESLYHQTFYK
jgi:hypothetical protein